MNVLYIDSGISGSESISRLLTASIVERLLSHSASVKIVYRDLVSDELPYMNLKTLPGAHPFSTHSSLLSDEEASARSKTQDVLDEFLAADVIVLGVPMYNFGIPAQLKSWFDSIVIPGITFAYTADGPRGLARSKRVILAVTYGSCYGAAGLAMEMEHAESYVRSVLSFIGISDLEVVLAEGVAFDRSGALERSRKRIDMLLPIPQTSQATP